MKINEINIEKFAKDEYSQEAPSKEGINGRDILIFGENRTGKSLSFNAILYSLLGSQETIDLSTGVGNRVTLSFTNDTTFARGHPEAELSITGDTTTGETAQQKFAELLGETDLVKHHFLHSHTGRLPLTSLRKNDRLALIRSVTDNTRQQRLTWNKQANDHAADLLVEAKDGHRRIKEEKPDLESQISSTERQLEQHRTTLSLIESGQLERIGEQLQRDGELEEELDSLFREQEGIRQELNRLYKRKRRHEGYTKDVIDIIADAVNDFVCPACDRRVSSKDAKKRMKSGYCPYCRQKGSVQEVKDRIGERVESASEIVEKLEADIEEVEQRKSEINAEIDAVKAQKPELDNLDAPIKRRLKEHDYDVDQIAEAVDAEIHAAEDTLEGFCEAADEIEEELELVEGRIKEFESSIKAAETAIQNLEETSYTENIQEFAEAWTENYRAMAGDLGFEIGIKPEGDVIVPGGTEDESIRHYDRLGDLSDSEVRLLNISFVYTLNEKARATERIKWQVFVLDEPFASLDQASTDALVEFIQEIDQQFIVTSSNNELRSYFDDYHTISLERAPIQSELGEFL